MSECSHLCGGGHRTRTRFSFHPLKQTDIDACGVLEEHEPCNTHPCAVNCAVSNFSDWGACSRVCGGGSRLRTRIILTASQNGGHPCPANLTEVEPCNTFPCPRKCKVNFSLVNPLYTRGILTINTNCTLLFLFHFFADGALGLLFAVQR